MVALTGPVLDVEYLAPNPVYGPDRFKVVQEDSVVPYTRDYRGVVCHTTNATTWTSRTKSSPNVYVDLKSIYTGVLSECTDIEYLNPRMEGFIKGFEIRGGDNVLRGGRLFGGNICVEGFFGHRIYGTELRDARICWWGKGGEQCLLDGVYSTDGFEYNFLAEAKTTFNACQVVTRPVTDKLWTHPVGIKITRAGGKSKVLGSSLCSFPGGVGLSISGFGCFVDGTDGSPINGSTILELVDGASDCTVRDFYVTSIEATGVVDLTRMGTGNTVNVIGGTTGVNVFVLDSYHNTNSIEVVNGKLIKLTEPLHAGT